MEGGFGGGLGVGMDQSVLEADERETRVAARIVDGSEAINAKDGWGYAALHCAAAEGDVAEVRHILSIPGVDVNVEGKSGRTPLHMASYKGHSAAVKLLLSAPDIDVNRAENEDGRTPLHTASEKGHAEGVKLLLGAPGIDVNRSNRDGRTPLEMAENDEIRALLRAAGATG